MKYEDFKVKTFNDEGVVRVTHKGSGISRESGDVTKEGVTRLMQDIAEAVDERKRPCSFATALDAVITEEKGMHIVGDPTHVVRAQFPDEYSMMDLPYLYITTEVGQHPWTVDSCSPFATWMIV